MTTNISFDLAKLLKAKGFDELTIYWHQRGDGIIGCVEGKRDFYNRKGEVYTSAPTIAEVVMWLYEKHSIWISVDFDTKKWFEVITVLNENNRIIQNGHNSQTEAYEAAIKYCLENLC